MPTGRGVELLPVPQEVQADLASGETPRNSIIIPAYEEQLGLPVVLAEILGQIDSTYEVIVVDDGSRDGTWDVAHRFPCRTIRHERNQGKGAAIRTGVLGSRGGNIIWIDADGTYPAEHIPEMICKLEAGYDLVVARRVLGRANIPAFNRLGNALLRFIAIILYRRISQDPFTGLCCIRRRYLEEMELSSDRFGIEIEVAVKAARMKLRVGEVPIHYGPRIGETKLNGVKAGIEILVTLLRFFTWRPRLTLSRTKAAIDQRSDGSQI